MRDQPGYDDWKCTPPDDDEPKCSYPECECPFDMGPDDACLRGYPKHEED